MRGRGAYRWRSGGGRRHLRRRVDQVRRQLRDGRRASVRLGGGMVNSGWGYSERRRQHTHRRHRCGWSGLWRTGVARAGLELACAFGTGAARMSVSDATSPEGAGQTTSSFLKCCRYSRVGVSSVGGKGRRHLAARRKRSIRMSRGHSEMANTQGSTVSHLARTSSEDADVTQHGLASSRSDDSK